MSALRGAFTAMITPMNADGSVDYEGFRKNVLFQLEKGIDGLVPLGTTGETPTLAEDEEEKMIEIVISEVRAWEKSHGKKVVYPLTHEECRKFFRYRDPLAHPAVMFRPTYFEKVPNGYRPEYRKNQDTMLWYDGFLNGCVFANLPDVVLNFRVIDDFYNRRNGWKRAKQML